MTPFEALYRRKCRSPLHWSEVGEISALGPDVLQEAKDKVRIARERLLTAQSRQRSYADRHRRDLEFLVGDYIFLKLRDDLSFEEQAVRILAREVKKLRNRDIPYLKSRVPVLHWARTGTGPGIGTASGWNRYPVYFSANSRLGFAQSVTWHLYSFPRTEPSAPEEARDRGKGVTSS
uniref:Uncharacterized protein n=1 Tax=Ananas comosus var. bracteatus TaxID=296719 RepID=A0A6V7QCE8_ANACO|nr:unnamed protein product [Ananas comosus var. bracteatus]